MTGPVSHDSLERRLARSLPRLLLYSGIGAIVATVALRAVRGLAISPLTAIVRVLLAGLQGVSAGFFVFALVLFGCALAAVFLRRVFGDGSVVPRLLAAIVGAAVLAFVFLVPMCLGSLSEGTYECITLAQRTVSLAKGQ